jgi:hypothetical protein
VNVKALVIRHLYDAAVLLTLDRKVGKQKPTKHIVLRLQRVVQANDGESRNRPQNEYKEKVKCQGALTSPTSFGLITVLNK